MVCLEWDSYLEFSSQEAVPLLAFRPERAGFRGGASLVPAGVSGYFWSALSPAPNLGDKVNRLPMVSPLGCSSVPTSVPPSLCLPESSCDFHM